MNLIVIAAFIAACGAAKLDRSYLPPPSAKSAGGSPGSLQTPFAGNSFNQGLGGLPKGSFTNDFQGVVVDAETAGTRASGPGESGLGQPRISYGSTASKVGEAAFQDTSVAGFRQVPGGFSDGQTAGSHVSSQFNQGSERPQAAHDRSSNTVRFDSEVGPESFNYAFETDNGIVAEENGVENNGVQAKGGFSYTGDDGQVYSVSYTADEGGYQPKGDHLPTPPPIPEDILRSLEQNAREEAAGIVDDGAYDATKYNTGGDYTENDSSGQYNAKSEQSGNQQPDASVSGSFISQSNLRRPGANRLPTVSGNGISQGKSANAIASVSGSGPSKHGSRNEYLPPGQQGRPQGVSGQDDTGSSNLNQDQNAFGNFQPLSPIKPQGPSGSATSAFASTQPDFRAQFQQHQQSTNGKPNQFTPNTDTFSAQGQDQRTASPFGASGSSSFRPNAQSDSSHTPSQSSSSSAAFHSQSPNGRPQFGINSNNVQNQGVQSPSQSSSSFASFNSQRTPTGGHSQFGINGDKTQNNNAQVPTQTSSFASPNTPSGSSGFGPAQRPTQSSSFASFNYQPHRGPSNSQFNTNTGQQGSDGGSNPTGSSTSAFTSSDSQSNVKPQSELGTHSKNIQQGHQASGSTSFDSFNPQASTPSNGHFGGKVNLSGTDTTFSSANTHSPTQPPSGSGSPSPSGGPSRPQFGAQSQSSVHQGPGQTSSSSFASFNSQPPTGPINQPSSQITPGFGNQQSQFTQNGPVDIQFSSSTQRPAFGQKQDQDDSYYYKQPAKPFNTLSSQVPRFPSAPSRQTQSSFSTQNSGQSSNAPSRFPSTFFPTQAQGSDLGHSRQPSVGPTSPTQTQFSGITQATASSFPASAASPTPATNFNSHHTGQFGSRPTSSHYNSGPQSPQSGKHSSPPQAFAQKPNQFGQTSSSQSQSIEQQSGNQPDSPENESITSQQHSGEIYEYNKPRQSLPVPSHADSTSGQLDQNEQSTQLRPQSSSTPQNANQFDTQSSGSHLTPQGQPAGSTFGHQQFGQKGQSIQTQFNVQSPTQIPYGSRPQFNSQSGIPQTGCCQGSTASAQSNFGPNFAQSVATSQFNNVRTPSQSSGQFQGHFGGQNSGVTTQGSQPDQPSRQTQGNGQFQGHFNGQNLGVNAQGSQPNQGSGQFQGQFGVQSAEATAQTFRPGQTSSFAGKGEVFGGNRKPPSFDAQTGYHY